MACSNCAANPFPVTAATLKAKEETGDLMCAACVEEMEEANRAYEAEDGE